MTSITISSYVTVISYPLTNLVYSQTWQRLETILFENPKQAQIWLNGAFLLIHYACQNPFIPLTILDVLLKIYPESIKIPDKMFHRLPLHYVTNTINIECLIKILMVDPDGTLMKDIYGDTPLHHYITSSKKPCIMKVRKILQVHPEVIKLCDEYTGCLLHRAVKNGNVEVVLYLISVYSEALHINSEVGLYPKDIAKLCHNDYLHRLLVQEENKRIANIVGSKRQQYKETMKYLNKNVI